MNGLATATATAALALMACGDPSSPVDAGASATTLPERRPPPGSGATWRLSDTGLYANLASRTVASDVVAFTPTYPLWSDATDKRRWLYLPPGTRVDTSNMDHWDFPVGARVWKEFSRDGTLLETRLIARTGPGPMDYFMGAFVWNAEGTDAVWSEDGQPNVLGTDHDVPASKTCWNCHVGEAGRVLGFSALQLGADALDRVRDRLSAPPARAHALPGEPAVREALGYLHANCGHCHNDDGVARRETNMILRVGVGETQPQATALYATTIGAKMQRARVGEANVRVVPGQPDASGLLHRMTIRGMDTAMPPIASKHVDATGMAAVRAWIAGLKTP